MNTACAVTRTLRNETALGPHPMTLDPHFLGMNPATAADPSAPYAVLPLPYERTVTYGTGTAGGPAALLEASGQIEDFD